MAASCGASLLSAPGWCSRSRASCAGESGALRVSPAAFRRSNPTAPTLVQALALLLQSEQDLPSCSTALRARVAGSSGAAEIDDVIAALLVSRFSGRAIQELCAMGGITLEDFTQSVAYREIFGWGRQEGWQEGELDHAMRLLQKRCGSLAPEQQARIGNISPHRLEALAEALLDFQGMAKARDLALQRCCRLLINADDEETELTSKATATALPARINRDEWPGMDQFCDSQRANRNQDHPEDCADGGF